MVDESSPGELPEELKDLVLTEVMTEKEAHDWVQLKSRVENCKKCSLHHMCTHKVFGEGFPKAPFFFVGESPGEKEDVSGRPFVGKSGRLLRKCMYEAGYRKGDVFFSNVLKCRPPKNRKPSKEEVGKCFLHLWWQMEIIKPKVIVAVGSTALDAFSPKPKKALGSYRGDKISAYGYKLVPVWHPSYVLKTHQSLRVTELVKDLGKAFALVYPDGRPETDN